MIDENDNVVTGEILSSESDRNRQKEDNFEEEFYTQFQIRRIKMWHLVAVLVIVLLIIALIAYVFVKFIEIFLIVILAGFLLSFIKGIIK